MIGTLTRPSALMILYHTLSRYSMLHNTLGWPQTGRHGSKFESEILCSSATLIRRVAMPLPMTTGVIPLALLIYWQTEFVRGWHCVSNSNWRTAHTLVRLSEIVHLLARILTILTTWEVHATPQCWVCELTGIVDHLALFGRRWDRRSGFKGAAQPRSSVLFLVDFFRSARPPNVRVTGLVPNPGIEKGSLLIKRWFEPHLTIQQTHNYGKRYWAGCTPKHLDLSIIINMWLTLRAGHNMNAWQFFFVYDCIWLHIILWTVK